MIKIFYKLLLFASATCMFLSCDKTIVITPPPYSEKVSIQGMLEVDSTPIIYVNKTVPYFNSRVTFSDLVIRNATVKISDGSKDDVLKLDSVFDKIYCEYDLFYRGSLPIKENKTYTLSISIANDVYTATASTRDLARAIVDSVAYTSKYNDLYGEHEGVIVYFKDVPGQTNFYRYQMDRFIDTATKKSEVKIVSPCLGKDSVAVQELGRSVYSDVGQDGRQLKIVIEPAYSHKKGTQGLIYVQTIDKNAFDFFDQLDKQKLSQLNPFVEPLFLKDGQFGKNAIGYFSAMLRSKATKFSYPE